jgi:hypothetical protein
MNFDTRTPASAPYWHLINLNLASRMVFSVFIIFSLDIKLRRVTILSFALSNMWIAKFKTRMHASCTFIHDKCFGESNYPTLSLTSIHLKHILADTITIGWWSFWLYSWLYSRYNDHSVSLLFNIDHKTFSIVWNGLFDVSFKVWRFTIISIDNWLMSALK